MGAARRLRPVPETSGRAILYVRVSALMGRSGEDFHSPDMQVEAMRRAIGVAGLREAAIVEDLDRSGQNFSREGINKIRHMVEAKQADVVAVYDLSRLGRNLAESLAFIRWLREHNVSVMSAQERIDDTPEGQYMLGMFLGLAELYGAQIGRRWAQIVERRARSGKIHGVIPQGYLRYKGLVVDDPVLGPAVTEMFASYARGDYLSDITRRFGAARGRPIRRGTVKGMLRNPVYRGRVRVRSQIAGVMDIEGQHPPLVDDDIWQAVQQRLALERRQPPGRPAEPKYSLTGLVWCEHCKGPLQVWYSPENGGVRRMVCATARQEPGSCRGVATPRYEQIEDALLDRVVEYAAGLRGNPAAFAVKLAQSQRAGLDAVTLRAELADTLGAMAKITQRWARGGMPDAAYEMSLAELAKTEQMLSSQLDQMTDVVQIPPPPAVVVGLADDLMRLWPELTGPERNRALRTLVVRVHIRRSERWREPVADRMGEPEFRY